MLRMAGNRQPQMVQGRVQATQKLCDLGAASQMRTMGSPSGDDHICPRHTLAQNLVIVGPDGIVGLPHQLWVCFSESKNIGYLKRAKPQGTGAPFTPFNRGVIVHLGRF